MRRKIAIELLVIAFLFLTVPSLLVGIASYRVAKGELDQLGARALQNQVTMAMRLLQGLDYCVQEGHMSLAEAQERAKALLIGEQNPDGTRSISLKSGFGESDYFYVLDARGMMLAHPNSEGEDFWLKQTEDGIYFIQEIIAKAQGGGGFTYYDWPLPHDLSTWAPKVAYGELEPNWGWIVVTGSYLRDLNSGADRILDFILLVLAGCLLVGTPFVLLFSRQFAKPLMEVTDRLSKISEGVLGGDPVVVKHKNEIGVMARALNHMEGNLRGLVAGIVEAARQVASISEEMSKASEETGNAAEEIASVIEEIHCGMDEQLRHVHNTQTIIQEVTGGVFVVSESNKEIAAATAEVSRMAAQGELQLQETMKQMDTIARVTQETAVAVGQLGAHSRQVESFLAMIRDIAGQTNLLALNAAIEAARAGAEGRGFAVVADEVRKLADESQQAANEIAAVVQEILRQLSVTEAAIRESNREVMRGLETITKTREAFDGILAAIQAVSQRVEGAVAASEKIEAGAVQQSEAMDSMVNIITEISQGMEKASVSSEEQAAAVEEISASANVLAQTSRNLLSAVANFKIK